MLATAEQRMDRVIRDSGTEVQVTRKRADQAPVFDPVTGNLTQPAPINVYTGPALVNFMGIAKERLTERGGESESESRFQCSVPLGAGPVKLGDEVRIVKNVADPQFVDVVMWVAQMPSGSGVARRRLLCSSVQVDPR